MAPNNRQTIFEHHSRIPKECKFSRAWMCDWKLGGANNWCRQMQKCWKPHFHARFLTGLAVFVSVALVWAGKTSLGFTLLYLNWKSVTSHVQGYQWQLNEILLDSTCICENGAIWKGPSPKEGERSLANFTKQRYKKRRAFHMNHVCKLCGENKDAGRKENCWEL